MRHGPYYYPARLLLRIDPDSPKNAVHWRIRWWRHCSFVGNPESAPSLPEAEVPQEHIVDELWNDRTARRQIQVEDLIFFEAISLMISDSSDNGFMHRTYQLRKMCCTIWTLIHTPTTWMRL